jgi:hypothetical protein
MAMKKVVLKNRITVCLTLIALFFTGCNNLMNETLVSQEMDESRNSIISKRIGELKNARLFDSLLA